MGHESDAPWIQRPKRERARWVAKRLLDEKLQQHYGIPEDLRLPLDEWLETPEEARVHRVKRSKEWDATPKKHLRKMNVDFEKWLSADEEEYEGYLGQVKRLEHIEAKLKSKG